LNSVQINAMIEKVELNQDDKDQTLLIAVINDLIKRLERR